MFKYPNLERIEKMYIEVREKTGKYYVIIRHEDSKEKPVAQFVSSDKSQS